MTAIRFPRLFSILATTFLVTPVWAQEAPEEPDAAAKAAVEAQGFRLPPQLRQIAYRDANPWVLHTNVRVGEGDSNVTFGGLGAIPFRNDVPGADQVDAPLRVYDDGAVGLDEPRADELDADGNQTSTPGGTYDVFDDDGNLLGTFVSYTPGLTRNWAYQNEEQAGDGTISLNQFSTQSTGAAFQREAESSGIGFEMAVSRRIMKLGRKAELNFSAAVGLSDFSASTSSTITADLVQLTDVYQISGDIPDAPFQGPSIVDLTINGPDGNPVAIGDLETTVPLQQITPDRRFTTVPDGATVLGSWAIDGAYYSFRLGPEVRGHVTERIAFSAGAGLLGAVIGSDFSVSEALVLEDYLTSGTVGIQATDSMTELVLGYYAEASIEYWLTQRTGLFLGAVLESIDDFNQQFGGRTASVMLGEALVVRFGIVHRF